MVKDVEMNFNTFCYQILDGLFNPLFAEELQCTGYKMLKKMVKEKITPSSEEEYEKYVNNPTPIELISPPDIKHLVFLHVLSRRMVRRHWDKIKNLELQ